jgi:hypothetical protein
VVGITSAAAVFWFAVPEAFSIGSLTIVVAFCLASAGDGAKSPFLVHALGNLVALSVTLTNWMVGILAAILNLRWRRALAAIAGALLITSILWGLEKVLFPNAEYFLTGSGRLSEYMYYPSVQRVVEVGRVFFSHSIVMPGIGVEAEYEPDRPRMTVQQSSLGSGSIVGYGATVAWIALFCLGIWASASAWRRDKIVMLVGLTTGGQLALHVLFGGQTFLYCMHFVPLLLMIASRVTQTRLRTPGLVLAGIVAAGALVNNQQQFMKAVEFVRYISQIAAAYHP